jgi:protein-S-isoprenylcysteine O-methyltransferase Ste14
LLWAAGVRIFARAAKNKMKRRLKINAVIMFCAFLAIVLFPVVFFRKFRLSRFEVFLQIAGVMLIFCGQCLRICARGYKAENSQSGHALIRTGPYALVRNPMYLGILLIGCGIVLVLFKWWVIAVFLSAFTFRYILLTLKEEKELAAIFPNEYPLYREQVSRLLPNLSLLVRGNLAEYLPFKSSWIKKEIGSVAAVLMLVAVLWFWRRACFS